MRLIDADELKKAIDKYCEDYQGFDGVIDIIDNAPTVEERPQGEWIIIKSPLSNETIVKCNKCGEEFIGNDVEDYNYCPICGADMRKENKE